MKKPIKKPEYAPLGAGMKRAALKLVFHKEEKSLKWWVETPIGRTPIARFEFPLDAEGFMYVKDFLYDGIDAVPTRVQPFFKVT